MKRLQSWLSKDLSVDEATGMLKSAPEEFFDTQAVDRRVNNARIDDADCLRPV